MEGKQHLDVGCAYGGFMVAFSEHGIETCGFDIYPQLLKLAQKKLTDFGRSLLTYLKDGTNQAEIEEYSGCFDIITCNDVIEHVSDVALMFKHISQMLTQEGVAFFVISNRDEAPFLISDGHYQLFGIAQFYHADAVEYFIANSPSTPYGIENYYRLHEYKELLEGVGLFMEILPETLLDVDIQTIQLALVQLEQSLDEKMAGVPESVRSKMHDALLICLKTARSATKSTVYEMQNFKLKYGASFW